MDMTSKLRIVFLGTPEFALSSLEALISGGYDVAAVVTTPDQPSGRGLKMTPSPVKTAALKNHIPVLQPEKLKNGEFIDALKDLRADLFIVVAFRMLPEVVWNMPPLGTFNLHASLLPQYRGAAPIHHAIMNGETETGLTTFFLTHEIDTGLVIFQEKIPVGPEETTGELHDRMKVAGARLVLKTVDAISSGQLTLTEQKALVDPAQPLKTAPKIFKEDCKLDWADKTHRLFDKIRGLNPVPAAFTTLLSPEGETFNLKIYRAQQGFPVPGLQPGRIIAGEMLPITIITGDGSLILQEVQLAGKRRMAAEEFLRGFRINSDWKAV